MWGAPDGHLLMHTDPLEALFPAPEQSGLLALFPGKWDPERCDQKLLHGPWAGGSARWEKHGVQMGREREQEGREGALRHLVTICPVVSAMAALVVPVILAHRCSPLCDALFLPCR